MQRFIEQLRTVHAVETCSQCRHVVNKFCNSLFPSCARLPAAEAQLATRGPGSVREEGASDDERVRER